MGRAFDTPTDKQAAGIQKGALMKIVCAFDIETWQDIRTRAVKRRVSVAEYIRQLCEIGLEVDRGQ